MTRRPSMFAAAITRRQRKALRQEMARISQIADEKLKAAVSKGLLDPAQLPEALQRRLAALDGRVLQGHVEGDTVVIDPPPAPSRRGQT